MQGWNSSVDMTSAPVVHLITISSPHCVSKPCCDENFPAASSSPVPVFPEELLLCLTKTFFSNTSRLGPVHVRSAVVQFISAYQERKPFSGRWATWCKRINSLWILCYLIFFFTTRYVYHFSNQPRARRQSAKTADWWMVNDVNEVDFRAATVHISFK